jgi:sarcosine oxidase subunit gamma
VSDLTLTPAPALGGYRERFEGVQLEELPNLAIVSIATPRGGEAEFAAAIERAFGVAAPKPGHSTLSKDGQTRLVGMAPDQTFAVFTHDRPDARQVVDGALDGAGYTTDQTDVWVALRIDGPRAHTALERICPIDLHPDAFPEGRAARTVMEHLGTIVLRDGTDSFLLLSAHSSAESFLHAVETSIRNVT